MGFRFRKSISIMPGIRLNFSKSGVGFSGGFPGFRITKRADGKVMRTLSIPGTGISHVEVYGGGRRGSRRKDDGSNADQPPPPPAPPKKPGLFAPKGEKELYDAVVDGDLAAMERVTQEHRDQAFAAATLAGILHFSGGNHARARELLAWVWATGTDPGADEFLATYIDADLTVHIATGVTAELGLDRDAIGLALAELHQRAGEVAAAVDIVEDLEPTTYAALSLAELYAIDDRWADVVDLTDGVTNVDDATALLCTFRGVALREQGFFDAARLALREALRSRSREPVIRHRAWFERAECYRREGKRAQARKDLERILAEDSDFPGLTGALAAIG